LKAAQARRREKAVQKIIKALAVAAWCSEQPFRCRQPAGQPRRRATWEVADARGRTLRGCC